MSLPLEGVTVLEFSQYLAGPYAGLRLADLGARVIKIERPGAGDACRSLATKNMWADGDSVLFHTINRNKESFAANLKDPADLELVKALIKKADVITHNFRPGIMARIGLDYDSVQELNPAIVYGEVSGYGEIGPWKDKPGQDLLAQSVSGLTWLTGNADQAPKPMGIAVADMLTGTHFAQGLLAALLKKKRTGQGSKVNVSLLESIIDFQFEGFTAFLNNGQQLPERSAQNNAHAYLGAPYGIYKTADSHIAISMGDLKKLCESIGCLGLEAYYDVDQQYSERDLIKAQLAKHFISKSSAQWLAMLKADNYWSSAVLDYKQLSQEEAYKVLDMELDVKRDNGVSVRTTRCPIRLNGAVVKNTTAAPALGNANAYLFEEFGL
ncbi:CaiB/BaiF CoA transferase family protein [Agaribacterium sp. ZY112]|uniref:CaiB/BaiF CoA transferase family protein n=1 Tax=Agaribacterium sp. ZY112 TaxID=3233574 RepID=UPI003526B7DA